MSDQTNIGTASDIILTGGNRVTVAMPSTRVLEGIAGAIQRETPFITFPQIAGDVTIAIPHIAAVLPRLAAGRAQDEAEPPAPKIEVAS